MKPTDDLISRQAAIDAIDKRLNELCGKHLNGKTFQNRTFKDGIYDGYYRIRSDIQIISSAQPEVIKCKDCKYAHITYGGEVKYCDIWFPDESHYIETDNYCSFAERRTDGRSDKQKSGD